MRVIATVCGLVAAALCGGCLQKDMTQSIYLAPGGVVWSVIERDVRSDTREPAGRIGEESDYFLAASAGNHPVAQALRRLLDDPALRTRMGAAGRRAVESYYNWDRVTADLVAIGQQHAALGAREAAY